MKQKGIRVISCDGLHVAITLEALDEACIEQKIYYPANYLIYVEHGELSLNSEGKNFSLKSGEFGFFKKHTHGILTKAKEKEGGGFRDHMFVFQDEFLKEVIHNFPLPDNYLPCTIPLVKLKNSPVLLGLMKSLEVYANGQTEIDRALIRLKTMEALHGLLQQKPELIHILNEFCQPFRADLVNFIEYNYTKNLSLDQFAKLSGRSLSTFTREFKKEFNMAPYKWLKSKRLEYAKKLLLQTKKTVSEVYLEVGFEDLAHFSRSFKSHFGINPSEVKIVNIHS